MQETVRTFLPTFPHWLNFFGAQQLVPTATTRDVCALRACGPRPCRSPRRSARTPPGIITDLYVSTYIGSFVFFLVVTLDRPTQFFSLLQVNHIIALHAAKIQAYTMEDVNSLLIDFEKINEAFLRFS